VIEKLDRVFFKRLESNVENVLCSFVIFEESAINDLATVGYHNLVATLLCHDVFLSSPYILIIT